MSSDAFTSPPTMGDTQKIFMLGIGGSGMSGIAEVLAQLGQKTRMSKNIEKPNS